MTKLNLLFLFLFYILLSAGSDFCQGWREGYCRGYRSLAGQRAVCPTTPKCPKRDIDERTYNHGFDKGFKKGYMDAKEKGLSGRDRKKNRPKTTGTPVRLLSDGGAYRQDAYRFVGHGRDESEPRVVCNQEEGYLKYTGRL